VSGVGSYQDAARLSTDQRVADLPLAVLTPDGLERAKRAAGRVKDLLDLEEIAESDANRRPDWVRLPLSPPLLFRGFAQQIARNQREIDSLWLRMAMRGNAQQFRGFSGRKHLSDIFA
jgi:hypothetical protein